MRRFVATWVILLALLVACRGQNAPAATVPAKDAPFPATWTPTPLVTGTATATLVVRPTPTWDGTPPPPSRAFVPRISTGQLDRAIRDQERVTVVDGRALAAYEQVHISGALHIPFAELAARGGELDANALIVLYTWFLDETDGLEAAMDLYEIGFSQVAVLEGGMQTWYADGYAIEGIILTPTLHPVEPPWTVTPFATMLGSVTGTVTSTVVLESSRTPTATLTATE